MKKAPSPSPLLWLVGGGTGGHVMPLLAVAEELQKSDKVRLVYVGGKKSLEQKSAREYHLKFVSVPFGKLRRYITFSSFFLNIWDAFLLLAGFFKAVRLIRQQRPALIFSKGGPVALPVALAARWTHTELITHESDAVMGATNRFMSRFCQTIFTAFPATNYPLSYAKKIVTVGLPIRPEFCRVKPSMPRRPTIVVTGSSQGALAINLAMETLLPRLLPHVDIIHFTGAYSYNRFKTIKKQLPADWQDRYKVIDFDPNIVTSLAQATLVISRASSSIFEIASLGKPMILIPLPHAANNHQVKNAEVFAQAHAAVVIRQESLTPDLLYEKIEKILEDSAFRHQLIEGTRTFQSCDAAHRVAQLLLEQVDTHR